MENKSTLHKELGRKYDCIGFCKRVARDWRETQIESMRKFRYQNTGQVHLELLLNSNPSFFYLECEREKNKDEGGRRRRGDCGIYRRKMDAEKDRNAF
ncbi:MAG: hypothetical protein J7L30_04345 [Methanophagales archaeon]|nr:hypothetical protein [Methanophagales archaeon]